MSAENAYRRFIERGFRSDRGAVYLSDEHDALYATFLEAVAEISNVDRLVKLLTLYVPGPRDTRLELWVPVLQQVRRLQENDRDAWLTEVMVNLIYGEDEEGEAAWYEAEKIYADNEEVMRVGLVVGLTMKDEELVARCIGALPELKEADEIQAALDREDWDRMNKLIHYDPLRLEWFKRAHDSMTSS